MEMTTVEIAARLGISQRQVQRMVASGRIMRSRTVGRAFMVDASQVTDSRLARRAPGRPWAVETAWAALWSLSGLEASWLDAQGRRRLARRLAESPVDALMWSCRQRAEVFRCRASDSFLDGLRRRVRLTGGDAIGPEGGLMAATNAVEGYCTSTERAELVSEFFLIGDPKGNVTLRVTDFAPVVAWTGAMPAAVVGVDLAESSDPRQRSLGRDRLEEMLA